MTLKHRPDDLELRSALASFTKIARFALIHADRDSEAFKEFVREREPAAVELLVSEGENVAHLIAALETAIDEIDARIMPNMAGDVVAAKALIAAARRIQEGNEGEALQLR